MQDPIISALVIKSSMGGVQRGKEGRVYICMAQLIHAALGGFHKERLWD